MPKFGQVLGIEGEKLSVWRRLILIFPEERWVKNSNFVISNVYANASDQRRILRAGHH